LIGWFACVNVHSAVFSLLGPNGFDLGAAFVNADVLLFTAAAFWFGCMLVPTTTLFVDFVMKV
jgi:hypothetical protein